MGKLKRGFSRVSKAASSTIKALFKTGEKFTVEDLLKNGKKVIQMDMKDTYFLDAIHGSEAKFLGITDNKTMNRLKKEIASKELTDRLVDRSDYPNPYKNNADILVLSGESYKAVADPAKFSHSSYVLMERSLYMENFFELLKPLLKHALFVRLRYEGMMAHGEGHTSFMVWRVLHPRKAGTTKFLSPVTGIEKFFRILNNEKVSYAILRWFETFPSIKPGADIDMVVKDEDAEKVAAILNEEPGLIETDVYSVTGLPGFDFHGMANYPPYLAEEIIDSSILYKGIYRVPSNEVYFLSLAYHALYHKGLKAGIRIGHNSSLKPEKPKHDYSSVIREMAQVNKIDLEITLSAIHDYLKSRGWAPPKDSLTKLAQRNKWIKEEVIKKNMLHSKPGLVVFMLREQALELNKQEQIIGEVKKFGFDILYTKKLNDEEKDYVSKRIRGGNWGPGPYKTSGGRPALIVIAYDLLPNIPNEEQLKTHPTVDNGNVFIKSRIRDQVNQTLAPEMQCNMIHSSDNYEEALDYIAIAAPEYTENKVKNAISELQTKFHANQEHQVMRNMTKHGHRAKVELIKYRENLAVKKTYKSSFVDYCHREIHVMRNLAGEIDGIPELLEYGDNYFIVPYYEDQLKFRKQQPTLIPLDISKKAIEILKQFYDNGFALVDFNPGNIIYDSTRGVIVIDYEFLYKYKENEKPLRFEDCYDLAGIPDDFSGDKPSLGPLHSRNYNNAWKKYVGLSLESLLYDGVLLQKLKRHWFMLQLIPKRRTEKVYVFLAGRYGKVITSLRGRAS